MGVLIRCLFALLLLISTTAHASSKATNRNFFPLQKLDKLRLKKHEQHITAAKAALGLRGGAGPLDPTTTAKVATVIRMTQGLIMNVAPALANKQYGIENSAITDHMMNRFGTMSLAFALAGYCLIVRGTTLAKAIGILYVPWVVEQLRVILNDDDTKAGFSRGGSIFVLLVSVFMIYASTQDWSDTAIKASSAFWLLSGMQMALAPKAAANVWGNKSISHAGAVLVRSFGFAMAGTSLMTGAIAFKGVDVLKAYGYGYLTFALMLIVNTFLTNDAKKLGMPMEYQYAWILFNGIVGATLSL